MIGLSKLQHLKKLQLTWCRLSDAMITEISHMEFLEELELSRVESVHDDEKLATIFHNLPQLRTLKIHGFATVLDRSFKAIGRMTNLKMLRIINCKVKADESLGLPANLESFEAERCTGFKNGAMVNLLKVSPALLHLHVTYCEDLRELLLQVNDVLMSGQRQKPLTIPISSEVEDWCQDQKFSPLLHFCEYPNLGLPA